MLLPTVEDLKDYLVAAGLYSDPPSAMQSRLDLEGALNAAIERWNDLTHYWPFVSNGDVNEVRYFDPKISYLIDLKSGLLTFTSLATDLVYQAGGTNSLSSGTARVNYRDFRLKPTDAQMKGRPWTYIETGWTQAGIVGSIAITGEWGYCTANNVPNGARRGILAIAADFLMPQIAFQISKGGLTMLQRGDETKRWDLSTLAEGWKSELNDVLTLNDYVRHRVA